MQPLEEIKKSNKSFINRFFSVFSHTNAAVRLVWSTSKIMTVILLFLTLLTGIFPAVAAYIGKLIVDSVVTAMQVFAGGDQVTLMPVLVFVGLEALTMIGLSGAQRGTSFIQSIFRALLGQRVNEMILEKALTLNLSDFEDAEFYDKLTRARREASSRPLSLVKRTIDLIKNGVALASYAFLLFQFSIWAVVLLIIGGLPSFIVETKFSNDAFRLFHWRSPETRMQFYLETLIAREDSVKEVKLFQLGQKLLQRYKDIFTKLFAEDKKLFIRKDLWGFLIGLLSTMTFYGAYTWVVLATIYGKISLGEMTMYLLVFKQGQGAVTNSLSAISGMYEDNLYLSNLYDYLEHPTSERLLSGTTLKTQGPKPQEGIRFENVSFTYEGALEPSLMNVSFHLKPGESLALVGENGAGKTTIIKLLTRLHTPTEGTIFLDGLDLREWDLNALQRRVGVIFQDFVRYQLQVGENIGAGDVDYFEDESKWHASAVKGMAAPFIEKMKKDYHTQLGRWFQDGIELSTGQWQKIALSRAFMRDQADVLVLDEPTASMDAGAEAKIFEHFQELSKNKMTILISHRFSTVRMADHVIVIDNGQIIERGNHRELMTLNGHYAHLFKLQAKGYI